MSSALHAALVVASRSSTVSPSAARCSRAARQYGQPGLTYMTTLMTPRVEDTSRGETDRRRRTPRLDEKRNSALEPGRVPGCSRGGEHQVDLRHSPRRAFAG